MVASGEVEGVKFDYLLKPAFDMSGNAVTPAPFRAAFSVIHRGGRTNNVDAMGHESTEVHDAIMMSITSNTAENTNYLADNPGEILPSGRRVKFTLPTGQDDLLKVIDHGNKRLDAVAYVGGEDTDQVRAVAIGLLKNKVKKDLPGQYILLVELPEKYRIHNRALQAPVVALTGDNCGSAQVVGVSTAPYNSFGVTYGNASGATYLFPIQGRSETLVDKQEKTVDIEAEMEAYKKQQRDANDLANGVGGLSLNESK